MIIERLHRKLSGLTIRSAGNAEGEISEHISRIAARSAELENEIEKLVDRMMLPDTDKTAAKYINSRIAKLDTEKSELSHQAARLRADRQKKDNAHCTVLHNVMDKWNELSFDDKRSVIEVLIEKILVYPDRLEICWKI